MPEQPVTNISQSTTTTNNPLINKHVNIHQDSTDKLANSRSSSPSSNSSSAEQEDDLTQSQEDLTNSRHQTETTIATSNHSTPSLLNDNENAEAEEQEDSDPSGPFEGPEKLLEIWFASDQDSLPQGCLVDHFSILEKDPKKLHQDADGNPVGMQRKGLRAVPRAEWEKALDLVKCKVLSTLEGQEVDAYLLSESSMFIFPHKLILKTCGTTTLLLGLERLLRLSRWGIFGIKDAVLSSFPKSKVNSSSSNTSDSLSCLTKQASISNSCSNGIVASNPSSSMMGEDFKSLGSIAQRIFYSRKSFMFPERQKGPHKDWMLEVGVLDGFFRNGSAYTVGKMNGDHWLLYMSCPMDCTPSTATNDGSLQVERPLRLPSIIDRKNLDQDQTLEILMTHLSVGSCNRFYFPPPTEVMEGKIDFDEDATSFKDQGSLCSNQSAIEGPSEGKVEMDRGHRLGFNLSKEVGLETLFQNTMLDAFAFDPCGYSANAIVPKSSPEFIEKNGFENSSGYWTVHVTPEEDSSYASFETNVSLRNASSTSPSSRKVKNTSMEEERNADEMVRDLPSLISKVISIFSPGKMSITLFLSTGQDEEGGGGGGEEGTQADLDGEKLHKLQLKGYNKTVRIAYEFEGYDLVFVSFEKK